MNAPPFVQPTHIVSDNLYAVCLPGVEGRRLHCVLCEATGSAVFRLAFFKEIRLLFKDGIRRWNKL